MTLTLYIVAASVCILWAVWFVQLRSGWDDIRPFRSASRFLDTLPLVSMIMVVKEKNENITQTVFHLMSQNYPRMEIIVVNDRSNRYSGMRMDELKKWSTRDSRIRIPLRVIHITHLPKGWSGKNYAYYQAVKHARGRYVLFIDSEARMKEDTIYSVVEYVNRHSVDHVTLLPKLQYRNSRSNSFIKYRLFWWSFLRKPWKGNDSLLRSGGVGFPAFNFIRKHAYEQIGTHEAFKLAPDEADELGRLVKEYGYSQSVMFALDHVVMDGESGVNEVHAASIRTGLPDVTERVLGTVSAFILHWMMFIFPLIGWIPLLFIEIGPAVILFISVVLLIAAYRASLKPWEIKWTIKDAVLLPLNGLLLAYKTLITVLVTIGQLWFPFVRLFQRIKRGRKRMKRTDEDQ